MVFFFFFLNFSEAENSTGISDIPVISVPTQNNSCNFCDVDS